MFLSLTMMPQCGASSPMHALKVTAVHDSKQFDYVLSREPVDLVVVDLNLGREDGLAIVRNLATKSDVPIIVISGDRLDEAEKVVALELGATDSFPSLSGCANSWPAFE
ncbi:hypothetical protein X764_32425 [Mesorhizobium sp. LSHC440A00]|nr:hypothetical protein X764_32425 [Mesorhizobium sp. LSHC440A00]